MRLAPLSQLFASQSLSSLLRTTNSSLLAPLAQQRPHRAAEPERARDKQPRAVAPRRRERALEPAADVGRHLDDGAASSAAGRDRLAEGLKGEPGPGHQTRHLLERARRLAEESP